MVLGLVDRSMISSELKKYSTVSVSSLSWSSEILVSLQLN